MSEWGQFSYGEAGASYDYTNFQPKVEPDCACGHGYTHHNIRENVRSGCFTCIECKSFAEDNLDWLMMNK